MPQVLIFTTVFLTGLAVGSFLNCIIYRLALQNFSEKKLGGLEKGGSFLGGRSYCPKCRHQLTWRDLIPILSFFILKGKCRYCHQKISWQYPLVEIATGLLFVSIFNPFASTVKENFFFSTLGNGSSVFNFLNLIYYWTIASFLIIIFVYDLKHYLIPDRVIYPAIVIALIFNFQFLIVKEINLFSTFISINGNSVFNEFSIGEKDFVPFFTFASTNGSSVFNYSIFSAFGAAAFFLLIVLISRGKWMGIGDIKLAFLMGLILGFPNILVALFLAFFLGAIIGLGLIFSGRKTLKSKIPFGPFLITGTFIGLFCGGQIINWYLSFLI